MQNEKLEIFYPMFQWRGNFVIILILNQSVFTLTVANCLDFWCSVSIICGQEHKKTLDRGLNNLARPVQLQLCAFVQKISLYFTLKSVNRTLFEVNSKVLC